MAVGQERQHLAAVGGVRRDGAALHAHERNDNIDPCHDEAAEQTGADSAYGHVLRPRYARAADDVDHHDAKGQSGQRVHGVIPFQEAGEEGVGAVVPQGLGWEGGGGARQHRYRKHAEKQQEQRRQRAPDRGEDAGRTQ